MENRVIGLTKLLDDDVIGRLIDDLVQEPKVIDGLYGDMQDVE